LWWFLRKAHARAASPFVLHHNGDRLANIKRSFTTACRRAGLDDVTPHTLRHTAGTWMAQRGVDLWQVAGYLGLTHQLTTDIYLHHHPDFLEDARAALD
jgi:integrase